MHFQELEETGEIVNLVLDDGTNIPWKRDWFIAMVAVPAAEIPFIYRSVILPQLSHLGESEQRLMRRLDLEALKVAFARYRDELAAEKEADG